jgi:hypothetical protein
MGVVKFVNNLKMRQYLGGENSRDPLKTFSGQRLLPNEVE